MDSNNHSTNVFEKTMEEIRQLQEREKERLEKEAEFISEQLEEQARQAEEQRRNDRDNYRRDESLLIDVTRQNTMVQQHQFAQFQAQINNLHNSYNAQLSDIKSRWDREVCDLKATVKSQKEENDDLKRDNERLKRERDDFHRLASDLSNELENMKSCWFPNFFGSHPSSSHQHHQPNPDDNIH
uniref:Uncharacterized protein n=1 Tax=Panagrolaimus sp. JU765 TaxID=591449 RepID=A0AC34RRZ9_9BILA